MGLRCLAMGEREASATERTLIDRRRRQPSAFPVLLLLWATLLSTAKAFGVCRLLPQVYPDAAFRIFQASNDYDDYYSESTEASSSSAAAGTTRRPLRRPVKSSTSLQQETRRDQAQKRHVEALKDPTLLTQLAFGDRTDISPATQRAITDVLGLQQMTTVQAQTYAPILQGQNVLARARTGTGKTLAFLLPALERLLEADLDLFKPGLTIGMVVLVPTRELAIQIADQAEALLTFHPNDLSVACIYGGTKVQRDVRLLSGSGSTRLPTILVATPGRLLEHCEGTRIGRRKFSDMIQDTHIVVLDEADRLLEGFSKETHKILSYLPRAEKRQTLLFSATVSNKMRGFVKDSIKVDFTEVDCLSNRRSQGETNLRVQESYFVLDSIRNYIPTLMAALRRAMQEDENYKILVFFPTSKLVRFLVHFFNIGLNIPVLEIHSRMSQASRMRASNAFRSNKNAILFSSDVSARGVDYPDVSLVIQYGAPATEDAYIHRLGRTGRAGQAGRGLLVLLPFERQQIKNMQRKGMDVNEDMLGEVAQSQDGDVAALIRSTQLQVRSGHAILTPNAEAATRAFLAYYIANSGGLEPKQVLQHAEEFAQGTGLVEIPAMESKIASRLGLEGLLNTT